MGSFRRTMRVGTNHSASRVLVKLIVRKPRTQDIVVSLDRAADSVDAWKTFSIDLIRSNDFTAGTGTTRYKLRTTDASPGLPPHGLPSDAFCKEIRSGESKERRRGSSGRTNSPSTIGDVSGRSASRSACGDGGSDVSAFGSAIGRVRRVSWSKMAA